MAEPCNQPQPSISSRIEEARHALKRGWALAKLTGKKPVHKGWQKQKPAELGEVVKWITKGHNVGLRTGMVSGVIVVDDDSPDGSASVALSLPKTVTVITGSGKRHFYFQAPDFPVGNSVKTLAAGIDVRGDGGQVVFVGSIHPATGMPYAWAAGLSPEEVEIAVLPEDLLQRLKPKKKDPKLKLVEPAEGDVDNGDMSMDQMNRLDAYVDAAFDAEIDRVASSTEGSRNDTLNKAAFALGQLVGAGVLGGERARAALHAAATQAGLTDHEAEVTIASGLSSGAQQPRDLSALENDSATASPHEATCKSTDPRPTIRLNAGWLHAATTRGEKVLLRQRPPLFYQRGTSLVRVVLLPEGGNRTSLSKKPLIKEVTIHTLIDHLTRLIRWEKFDRRTEEYYPVDCTERVAQTLLSRSGDWILLPLVGVIDAPTLRSDGGVLAAPGYDKQSGIYLALGDQVFPAVPPWPTRDDALLALEQLLLVIKDFAWLEPVDRSVALAAILTALIRPSLRTSPLFAFRAAKMGSGKSLLADVVALIATGRPAAVMSQGQDENEDKKRMLPILMEGDPVASFDNVDRPFGSAALCSILTQSFWRDRVLGKSQTISLPTTNTTWIVTGNNIEFVGDITTRTIVCDLDPGCERPEERKFDVNLHQYIPVHRGELVVAGLTILRAYHVAGRPSMNLPVFGRFEEWSDWVRSAIVWLDLPDPCETRRRVEETDPVRQQLAALLLALHLQFAGAPFLVADVLAKAEVCTELHETLSSILAMAGPGQSPGHCLGQFFQRVHRRPEGGLRILRGNDRGGRASWRVDHV